MPNVPDFYFIPQVVLISLGALLGVVLCGTSLKRLWAGRQIQSTSELEIPGFGRIKTRSVWLVVLVLGCTLVAFSINTIVQISDIQRRNEIITSQESIVRAWLQSSLIEDPIFVSQMKGLDKNSRDRLILIAARVLANEYDAVAQANQAPANSSEMGVCATKAMPAAAFSHAQQLIHLLESLDRNNGHALYFSGEINRLIGQSEARVDVFNLYLESEAELSSAEKGGGKAISLCAKRPHGYCEQRTGWIAHVLANVFLQRAQQDQSSDIRKHDYGRALELAKFARRKYPEHGFDQCVPTDVVEHRAEQALGQ